MAEPAGLVLKACSGCRTSAPDGSLESASTYVCPGCNPVTAASSTCTSPWSDSDTLVGAFSPPATPLRPGGTSHSCVDCPASSSGLRPAVPGPSGTALGTYTTACAAWPIGLV